METTNENKLPAVNPDEEVKKFKGYTLEELRYQRALVALKREFARSKTFTGAKKVKNHNPFSSKGDGSLAIPGKLGGMATRLITGLNYMDYAMLGLTLFRTGRKIFRFFKGKK